MRGPRLLSYRIRLNYFFLPFGGFWRVNTIRTKVRKRRITCVIYIIKFPSFRAFPPFPAVPALDEHEVPDKYNQGVIACVRLYSVLRFLATQRVQGALYAPGTLNLEERPYGLKTFE